MKIMIVSHYLPPHVGGIEQVAMSQARALADRGHQVELVATTAGRRPGERAPSGQPRRGLRIRRLAGWNGIENATGVPFPLPAPTALIGMVRRAARTDVVHVHDLLYPTSWLAALAARLTSTPLVLTQHVGLVSHPSRLVRAVQRLVYATAGRPIVRQASRIGYLNGDVATFLTGLGATEAQLCFLPNMLDTEQFRPAEAGEREQLRAEFGLPIDEPLALFAGRFVPKKGFDVVLAAADPRYRLVLAGGDLGDEDRPGAEQPISVLGHRSHDELAKLYRACDIFVLPSRTEGFPLTVAEAMASGLAVITSDDPGYAPYGLDADTVTLVAPNAERVREALTALATDPARRQAMGRRARDHARRQFAPAARLGALESFYRAAVNRPAPPVRLPEPTTSEKEHHHVAA